MRRMAILSSACVAKKGYLCGPNFSSLKEKPTSKTGTKATSASKSTAPKTVRARAPKAADANASGDSAPKSRVRAGAAAPERTEKRKRIASSPSSGSGDRPQRDRSASNYSPGYSSRPTGDRKPFVKREGGPSGDASRFRKPSDRNSEGRGERGGYKPSGDRPAYGKRDENGSKPAYGERRPYSSSGPRPEGGRGPSRDFSDGKRPYSPRGPREDKPGFEKREGGDRERPAFREGSRGPSRDFSDGKRPYSPRGPREDKPGFEKREGGDRERPAFREGSRGPSREFSDGKRPYSPRGPREDKPGFEKREGGDRERPAFREGSRGPSRDFSDGKRPYSPRGPREDKPGFEKREGREGGDRPVFRGGSRPPKPAFDPKSRLGQQAPSQAKRFRRQEDAPSRGQAPDYDEKRITSFADRKPFSKRREKTEESEEGSMIRLNRFIAQAGLCSRREADDLISTGQITVNGKVVDQMGYYVKKDDVIKYGKRLLNREKLVYVLLNKPKDFITTTEDPEERKTVMSLVATACTERIYPVGRLDRNTTGLLLLTNDGELSEKLMHPSHNIRKIYQVDLDKPLTAADEARIREGVELEDGKAPVDELEVLSKERDIVGLSIHLGRNRIVRRIFESLGYKVERLDRVMYSGLTKKDLPRGNWRFLTEKEIINLKYFS